MRVLLIGGTMFIGKRLVARCLMRGTKSHSFIARLRIRLVPDVRSVVGDRNDALSVRSALAGRHFDAVYDIAYDMGTGNDRAAG